MDKNNQFKAIIGIFFLMAMLFIPSVSASWTERAVYSENDLKVELKSYWGFFEWMGIDQTIGSFELKSHKSVDEIKQVAVGNDVTMYYDFDFKEIYSNGLGDVQFINMKTGREIKRDYKFVYLTQETKTRDVYEEKCTALEFVKGGNETSSCEQVVVGKEDYVIDVWQDYNLKNIPKGNIRIGIDVETKHGDWIDGIWTIGGKAISKHAQWNSSLETGLVSWYKLDETSGTTAFDSLGLNNGTNSGVTINQNGKIGRAYSFDGTNDYISYGKRILNPASAFTINFWVNLNSFKLNGNIFSQVDSSWNSIAFVITNHNDGKIHAHKSGFNALQTSTILNTSQWYMITITGGTGTTKIYLNGVEEDSESVSWNGNFNTFIGTNNLDADSLNGKLDEVVLWSRILTISEIKTLYNEGDGCTYKDCGTLPFEINLTSPANAITLNNPDVDFVADVIATSVVENISLVIDNVIEQTNTSGVNGTYTFSETLSDGTYQWKIMGYDEDDNQYNSTTRTLTIDTTPNIQFVAPTSANATNISGNAIPVNVSLTETYFKNVTFNFYKGGVLNESITFTDGTRFYNKSGCACDIWSVNVTTCTTTNKCNSTETRTYFIDITPPVLSDLTNLTSIFTATMPINSTWSFKASDPNIDKCYYNTTDHAKTIVTCNSTITTTWATGGYKDITYCVNDTFGNEACDTSTIRIKDFVVAGSKNKDFVGEGDSLTLTLNVSSSGISSEFSSTTANITYNGVTYASDTKSTANANYIIFTKTIIVPTGYGNSTGNLTAYQWNWEIKNSTTSVLTGLTAGSWTIFNVAVSDSCAGQYEFLNWSLRDEADKTLVNVTTPNTALVEIDLTITSLENSSQTWSYANSWSATQTKTLCVPHSLLNTTSYQIDWVMGYESNGRVRKFHYLDNGVLDRSGSFNSYTSKDLNLYDLATEDSTTFLFTYTDVDGLAVANSIVHTFRKYIGGGVFLEVERSKQDNNGETHVHLVEEDVIYYFMITLEGEVIFTSDTYNAKCLSSPCAIALTGSATEVNWSIYDREGGKYTITSDKDDRTASVSFNIESSGVVNASLYVYENGSAILVDSDSLTATAGTITLDIPLSYRNTTYFMAIDRDGEFVKSGWVDMTEGGKDYFGTFGAILGAMILLVIVLMAVSEGVGLVIFTALGLLLIGLMQLVDISWMAVSSIIIVGAIIVFKLVSRRTKQG